MLWCVYVCLFHHNSGTHEAISTKLDTHLTQSSTETVGVSTALPYKISKMTVISVETIVFKVAEANCDTPYAFSGGKKPLAPLGVRVGRGHM